MSGNVVPYTTVLEKEESRSQCKIRIRSEASVSDEENAVMEMCRGEELQ